MNFEKTDTEHSVRKMTDFDYCEEYLRSISNKISLWQAVLRKAHSYSVVICRLIKKMQKRIKGEKLIQIFFFPKLPSACEVLIRRNVI